MLRVPPQSSTVSASVVALIAAVMAILFIVPLYAANEQHNGPILTAMDQTGAPRPSDEEQLIQSVNGLIPYYVQQGKANGSEWLRTTDFKLFFTRDCKPVYSLETIQPFGRMNAQGGLWFWQGRYAYDADENRTANIGIGWRKLSADKQALFGVNTFYDYGFNRHHARLGLGIEHFDRLAEYRANAYLPLSDAREISQTEMPTGILHTYERLVRGVDIEAGSHFANAPWLGLFLSGFAYDNRYHDDVTGYRLRSTMQLTPRLALEAGYTGSNESHEPYAKLTYGFANGFLPSLWGANNAMPQVSTDLTYKMLQKVDRSFTLRTERFSRFVSFEGNIRVSVTNSDGDPVQGVEVQAYQDGAPVGDPAITDDTGVAVLTGIDVGDYTVHGTYFDYAVDSDIITVERDQTAEASLVIPISGGNAMVQVVTEDEQPIAGAEVTATPIRSTFLGLTRLREGALFSITVQTGPDGQAVFNNLPPGNYQFIVHYNTQIMASISVPSVTVMVTPPVCRVSEIVAFVVLSLVIVIVALLPS